ncbi:MAG: 7-cyano-7-deazaguanine synthase QueC [FCB group bacterium]|jgi:7-cyano-7-deazaguanine synthase|nr:7-cyano-7-deazaguanine synthase QueC [FCB group bacterium]
MKVLVLHSGGLDSTVCLLMAMEAGLEVVSLGVDYGQRHRIEMEYAAAQCKRFGVPRQILKIQWEKPVRAMPTGRTLEEMRSGVSPAFLPGRNAVFLVLACAQAAGVGAGQVWVGVNAIDFSGYPDCRPEFLDAFRAMTNLAIPSGPEIIAPLIAMPKPQIAAEAHRLGLSQFDTWSCYQPSLTEAGLVPCAKCDACILHEHAWDNLPTKLRLNRE